MLRRDLLRAWLAARLGAWLKRCVPLGSGGAAIDGPNPADVYGRAFGWAERLRPEESERPREDEEDAATLKQLTGGERDSERTRTPSAAAHSASSAAEKAT